MSNPDRNNQTSSDGVLGQDAGGRPLRSGDAVRFCADTAHLYDQGKSDVFIVERNEHSFDPPVDGVTRRTGAILRLINRASGVWVVTLSTWVTRIHQGEVTVTAPPDEAPARDHLRELAEAVTRAVPRTEQKVVAYLLAWADGLLEQQVPASEKALLRLAVRDVNNQAAEIRRLELLLEQANADRDTLRARMDAACKALG